jgi:phage repressor protein C with HTH and peptisase S24 domain
VSNILNQILLLAENEGVTIGAIEKKIGASKGVLSRAINNKTDIQAKWITAIVENYPHYNPSWILTGKGERLSEMQIKKIAQKAIAHVSSEKNGIPLIPITAFAGFGLATFEDLSVEQYYDVPDFKQADFLIRMKGNSMYPKFSSGDVIACAIVKEALFFQWNKIYAILTNSQGILIKRVKKSTLPDNILMVSDNIAYDPFDVPVIDIIKIAIVIGSIRVE